ncbi:MAG: hemolysin family protein [Rickettsiales bacterium]
MKNNLNIHNSGILSEMDDPDSSKPPQRISAAVENKKLNKFDSPRTLPFFQSYSFKNMLKSLFGIKNDTSLKETLEEIIDEHESQTDDRMEPEERIILHNVLSFGETKVSDIMVPRTDISAVSVDISFDDLKKHIIEQKNTRIPVYEDTMDNMLGFLHVKDFLMIVGGKEEFDLRKVIRNLLFVPPSMKIIDLLVKMRQEGSHMVIVVDEYGGTDGLVTMEDLFEEIVGDIQDEHDEDEEQEDRLIKIADNIFEVNSRIRIEKLEKELGIDLTVKEHEDEFDTLGGLIFFNLGRVPVKGETINHESGIDFDIMDADPRRIKKVRIKISPSKENDEA